MHHQCKYPDLIRRPMFANQLTRNKPCSRPYNPKETRQTVDTQFHRLLVLVFSLWIRRIRKPDRQGMVGNRCDTKMTRTERIPKEISNCGFCFFLLQLNDSSMTLLGESQEEDRRHIVDLVLAKMQHCLKPTPSLRAVR